MASTVKGIKGQVKKHRRPERDLNGMEPTGRKKQTKDLGALVEHDCVDCLDLVLAPERVKRVWCGRCVILNNREAK